MSTGVLRFNDAADISIYFSDQSLLDELINLTEKYFWNYCVSFSYFICNTNHSKKEKHEPEKKTHHDNKTKNNQKNKYY